MATELVLLGTAGAPPCSGHDAPKRHRKAMRFPTMRRPFIPNGQPLMRQIWSTAS
jgi:hypothetical protein